MSVFRRIKTIVDSNINSFLDKAEDPEKLNRLMIAEMEEAAGRAENEVKKLEEEMEESGKRVEEAEKAISRWQKRAEMAIDKGQDDMAKEAVRLLKIYMEFLRLKRSLFLLDARNSQRKRKKWRKRSRKQRKGSFQCLGRKRRRRQRKRSLRRQLLVLRPALRRWKEGSTDLKDTES